MWNKRKSLYPTGKVKNIQALTPTSRYIPLRDIPIRRYCIPVQELSRNVQSNTGHKSKHLDPKSINRKMHEPLQLISWNKLVMNNE